MKKQLTLSRRRLISGVGLLILALLSFFYEAVARRAAFASDSGSWFWLVLSVLFFLSGAYLLFSGITPWRLPLPRTARRGLLAVAILAAVLCLVAILPILFSLAGDSPQEADAVILLCTLPEADGSLSPLMEARVCLAADYLKAYPAATVIVTGGTEAGGITEAAAAKAALISLGIPEERILTEESARTTAENFTAARKMIPEGTSAVVITSDFHAFRAKICARSGGFQDVPVLTAPSGGILFPHYVIREWMTLTLSVLEGDVDLFP